MQIAYDLITPENRMPVPEVMDCFALVLFEKGSGTHSIETVEYKVGAGQLHLVFPAQIHQWELDAGTTGHRLLINAAYFRTICALTGFSAFKVRGQLVISPGPEYFQKILAELLVMGAELGGEADFGDLIYLRCHIIISLLKHYTAETVAGQGPYKRDLTLLHRFQTLVEQNFREHKSVSFYAQQLNITANYLSILCNRRFKMPAQAIIQERIINEAQKLMKTQDLSVKEISFMLGFNEPAYFSSFFKAKTGITARQYKQQP